MQDTGGVDRPVMLPVAPMLAKPVLELEPSPTHVRHRLKSL
jgi:hypothetical protein